MIGPSLSLTGTSIPFVSSAITNYSYYNEVGGKRCRSIVQLNKLRSLFVLSARSINRHSYKLFIYRWLGEASVNVSTDLVFYIYRLLQFQTVSIITEVKLFDKSFLFLFLFTGFFKDLLANSKKVFHEMFKKTYGILYEQNSFVFTDLFKELENYYAKGTVSFQWFSLWPRSLHSNHLSQTILISYNTFKLTRQ